MASSASGKAVLQRSISAIGFTRLGAAQAEKQLARLAHGAFAAAPARHVVRRARYCCRSVRNCDRKSAVLEHVEIENVVAHVGGLSGIAPERCEQSMERGEFLSGALNDVFYA